MRNPERNDFAPKLGAVGAVSTTSKANLAPKGADHCKVNASMASMLYITSRLR